MDLDHTRDAEADPWQDTVYETSQSPAASALRIDAPGGFLEVGNAPALSPSAGLTVEAWVHLEYQNGTQPTILSKDPSPSGATYLLRIEDSRPQFTVQGSGGSNVLWPAATIPDNTPTHLAATYDGVTSKIFVDGVEVASESHGSGPLLSSPGALRIGRGEDLAISEQFVGQLDTIRLWDHARTPTEIFGGMDRELSGGPGLIAAWNLNGDFSDATGLFPGLEMGATEFVPSFASYAQSARFPATGGYLEAPHDPALVPATGLTIETWLEIDEYGGLSQLVRKDEVTAFGESYNLRLNSGRPYFAYNTELGGFRFVFPNYIIPLHTPTHLAATYDGEFVRIFVNGALIEESLAEFGPIVGTEGQLVVGGGQNPDNQFYGRLDSVRIWKMARKQGDIQATLGREIRSLPGLVASYEFNGDFTDSAGDFDLTVNGGTVELAEQVGDTIGVTPLIPEVVGLPTGACPQPIEVVAYGLPYLGQSFGFGVVGAPPNSPGILILASFASPVPIFSSTLGVNVYLDITSPFFQFVSFISKSDGLGRQHSAFTPKVVPGNMGLPLAMQYLFLNPCGPSLFNASEAMQVVFQH